MFNGLEGFLIPFMNPEMVALVGVGVFVGVYMAAIPGMSVTMAVSILISFTFSWDIYPALAIMMGIYVGGVYGGARSAILMNMVAFAVLLKIDYENRILMRGGKL